MTDHDAGTRQLATTLQRLLAIQSPDLAEALNQAAEIVGEALSAGKVDAFLYDPARDALVALGVSATPLARRERDLGLDRLPLMDGGGFVAVYQTGVPYRNGRVDADPRELARIREELGVRSGMAVPLVIGGARQGVLAAASTRPDAFSAADLRFLETMAPLTALLIERVRLAQDHAEAARLAQLVRLQSDLIAAVSHELYTPLTVVLAGLGGVEASVGAQVPPEVRALLASARQHAERLRLEIADLLAANQLDAGTLRLDRAPLDLRDVVQVAATEVGPLLQAKGQTLRIDLLAPLPVTGDSRLLRHAVANLLAYAARRAPPAAAIGVQGHAPPGEIHLQVRDGGPGIPAAELETIFDRFHGLGEGAGGSGLGLRLSIARSMIALHDGRLWAESGEGQGAAFHVSLPRAGAPRAEAD